MKKKEVIITIDENFTPYKFYNNLKFYKFFNRSKIYKIRYDTELNEEVKEELEECIIILNIKNKNKKIGAIFDFACRRLDKSYISKNHCEFENSKCFIQNETKKTNGCCGRCRYLVDGHCTQDSITCKLFFCNEIRKNKYCPKINDIKVLKYFLNSKEKLIFTMSFYKNKEEIIKDTKKNILFYLFTPTKSNK